ncbi:hypothetical protein GON26_20900 [Flavobacterium sp. GA093]|uniref:DUF6438 domain-containing protein n=1 Tax=Flavobacterium hydrocarbonoxydans TaxID=2683249 RepID=A0A6I4NYK5_9FLAO|nr:DUF6438 domain-containing protein [Flavobacterium hydrocarbonoxydans]MWB96829.1 hypothetical protein [Flavobacterium hydrocarbonoxydans]
MKPKIILSILTVFILYSCQRNNEAQLNKDILGEWTYVKTEGQRKPKKNNDIKFPPPSPFDNYVPGYIFLENNICENKSGYFKTIDAKERDDRKTFFLGTETKYKIKNDSLQIFDLVTKTWENQKIHSIIRDTLTTKISDSLFAKYTRTKYKINPNENYDKIIVSSSGCYGSCPVLNISIDNNGNVIYYGQYYNTKNGIFKSKITKNEYQKIQTNFKKADIKNLKDNYEGSWTDDETITITFIKNNKIVKSINDYGRQSPIALIWAYTPVRYLYQQIKLTPLKVKNPLSSLSRISFTKGNQICDLTKSESFYLVTEIFKGKETPYKFESRYQIEFWNDQDKKEIIHTDGRYFKCKDKIIDIGYNFLTINNLTDKFRHKDKYD